MAHATKEATRKDPKTIKPLPFHRTPPRRKTSANDPIADLGHFMTRAGKLPGFAQRRLDALISKSKRAPLTKVEKRELSEALDYIDAKSIALMEQFAKYRAKSS